MTFLLTLALSGVVAGLGLPLTPRDATLQACLDAKQVPVLYTSSPDFSTYAAPFNLRTQFTPAVIVVPTTVQHIQDAVVCASNFNIKVQARGGGHSYAAFSSGGINGAMSIDLQSFKTVSVDGSGVATVGGGVRLGDLATGIYNQAQRALPHGSCPGVGVGGHVTHGGYGLSSRTWGLALDTIVSMDVVLADGSTQTVTSGDLYWALRGAADSFGIVTSFQMQTVPAPSSVVVMRYDFSGLLGSSSQAADFFMHLQDFALNSSVCDRQIGYDVWNNGNGMGIDGYYFGGLQNYKSNVEPEFLRGLSPGSANVYETGWLDALGVYAGGPLSQPYNYTAHDNFFAKSLVTSQDTPLTRDAMVAYYDFIQQNKDSTGNPWFSIISLYGGADSQINIRDSSFSSYAHRDSLWVFQHYGHTNNPDTPFPSNIIRFIASLNDVVPNSMSGTTFGAYINYVDPTLSASQAHDQYYGGAVYSRLASFKPTIDPNATFWNPQAIGN